MKFMSCALALATTCLPACLPEAAACTDLAAYSVSAVVVDERGLPVQAVTVTYTANGSDEAPCDEIDSGFACGIEQVGTIVVYARKEGFKDASAQATVVQDDLGCHVVNEVVRLELKPDTEA